ncbi:glycosyltransferase family 2 protein [Rhizobium sp. ICMP 5592]|uniref:glycosyltransferase family 2 protein n=1 Tax=Rhizobium sp. ICMP 5592 TaxID=2292445 RepID=UPI00129538BC|nr:glycosyltransferase family 2 protein [Rhizobium sp. ICMP 5592]
MTDNQQRMLGIAAIMKNEAPYILEWVAFHRSLGISGFIIADNVSDDGSSELLKALDEVGLIKRIEYRTPLGQAPQLPAYIEIIEKFKDEFKWLAFIDADEFIVPIDSSKGLETVLANLDDDVGALAINWAIYGSSGRNDAGSGLVIERFTNRAEKDCAINRHYKTVLRCKAYLSNENHPHGFKLQPGYRLVHPSGEPVAFDKPGNSGNSSDIDWSLLRLQHYVIKSQAEFLKKKVARGRAMTSQNPRDLTFFRQHDRNEIADRMRPDFIAATKRELESIRLRLAEVGLDSRFLHLDTDLPSSDSKEQARGVLDKLEIRRGTAFLHGWGLSPTLSSVGKFKVYIGNYEIERISITRNERPDVARHFPGAELQAGFSLSFLILDIPVDVDLIGNISVFLEEYDVKVASASAFSLPPDILNNVNSVIIPNVPSMPASAREVLREALVSSDCYLEYGTGGSTIMACEMGVPAIFGVESDWIWLWSVKKAVHQYSSTTASHFLHCDLGPSHEWGFASDESNWKRWYEYPIQVWIELRKLGKDPDTVLIDGRFRVACFFSTLIFAKKGCQILFDDYFDRPYYKVIEKYIKPKGTADRMAVFEVPGDVDTNNMWIALIPYLSDQR